MEYTTNTSTRKEWKPGDTFIYNSIPAVVYMVINPEHGRHALNYATDEGDTYAVTLDRGYINNITTVTMDERVTRVRSQEPIEFVPAV